MHSRWKILFVVVAATASAWGCGRHVKVRSAVREELRWVDDQLIGDIHDIREWSTILGPAFAIELKTSAPFGQAVYCVTSRAASHRLLVFYGCRIFSGESRDVPSDEVANRQLKIKVEAFNQALGAGVQLGSLNKYIYASILARCLFDENIPPDSMAPRDLIEPRVSFDAEDGGYVFTLVHSYDERRRELRYWVVDTKDGGFIQSWKLVVQPEKVPNPESCDHAKP